MSEKHKSLDDQVNEVSNSLDKWYFTRTDDIMSVNVEREINE